MSRSPSLRTPDHADAPTVFDRLRQMHDQGDIDLVEEGGLVVTQANAAAFTARLQALSDQVSTLEANVAKNFADGGENLTQLFQDLTATRRELTRLYNILLRGED